MRPQQAHRLDVQEAVLARVALRAARAPRAPLAHRGREVVAEGVPVEVEREGVEGPVGQAAPLEDEPAVDRPLLGVEPGLDRVVRVARRALGERRQGVVGPERGQAGEPGRGSRAPGLAPGRGGGEGQAETAGGQDERTPGSHGGRSGYIAAWNGGFYARSRRRRRTGLGRRRSFSDDGSRRGRPLGGPEGRDPGRGLRPTDRAGDAGLSRRPLSRRDAAGRPAGGGGDPAPARGPPARTARTDSPPAAHLSRLRAAHPLRPDPVVRGGAGPASAQPAGRHHALRPLQRARHASATSGCTSCSASFRGRDPSRPACCSCCSTPSAASAASSSASCRRSSSCSFLFSPDALDSADGQAVLRRRCRPAASTLTGF